MCMQDDFLHLMSERKLFREGRRVYLPGTWKAEEDTACRLAELLNHNILTHPFIPEKLTVGNIVLLPEQRDAVAMSLSHRISMIRGGAGCGKTTLIRDIAQCGKKGVLVCAPTGKAAQNLRERTGMYARTVHSALGRGLSDDDKSLSPVHWPHIGTVIIDEASMLPLSLLNGILGNVSPECSVVLVGDTKQLLSIGSGNVLQDLLMLKVPNVCLQTNHRQAEASIGLLHNIVDFEQIDSLQQLTMDDSFSLNLTESPQAAVDAVAKKAVQMLNNGENFQVLAPLRATVGKLNRRIQQEYNPKRAGLATISYQGKTFHNGDKVIITKNNYDLMCWNGDIGILEITVGSEMTRDPTAYEYGVRLNGGRFPRWVGVDGLRNMGLAYAITVHKAQGSEFDDVLMPITMDSAHMLYRNLFYTVVSRARRHVTIYGSKNAVDIALSSAAPPRRSMLVIKTRNRMEKHAK